MKSISMLPSDYKKLQRSTRRREFIQVALAILTIVLIFSYSILKILSSIPAEKLRILKSENEILLKNIQALDYLSEQEKIIQKETGLVQKAVSNQIDWLKLYNSISDLLPEGIKLSSIVFDPGKDQRRLSFQGNAQSTAILSEWMDKMKELEYFSELELLYVRDADGTGSLVSFAVNAVIEALEPFKVFEEAAQ